MPRWPTAKFSLDKRQIFNLPSAYLLLLVKDMIYTCLIYIYASKAAVQSYWLLQTDTF